MANAIQFNGVGGERSCLLCVREPQRLERHDFHVTSLCHAEHYVHSSNMD